jgi:hypothetical protein
MAGTNDFYDSVAVLERFGEVANPRRYTPVPDDWGVAIADVRDSTGAIRRGLYKEVNVIGASVIAGVLNAVGTRRIPYVFTGDGAALCVPPERRDAVARALGSTRSIADQRFGLNLAVGLVPVADLREQGWRVMVARYRISEHVRQAVFMGRGLDAAEAMVKADPDGPYAVADRPPGEAAFDGLECRWDHVPSRKDETVAFLVRAAGETVDEEAAVYEDVLDALDRIYGGTGNSRPVVPSQLTITPDSDRLDAEVRLRSGRNTWASRAWYALKIRLQTLLGTAFMRKGWSVGGTDWGRYREDVAANTDFQKMDGTLRQVVVSTVGERERLEAFLKKRYRAGDLYYGLHSSDSAMITCLIFRRDKEHVHFVDGADGGYAEAAKALKDREAAA